MSTEGAGIGWNYSGGAGETNFFNNNANGVVPGGWTWIPTTNTSVGSPVMSLSQTGDLSCNSLISSGSVRAGSTLEWGSNFFGKLSWNVSGGSGEIAIQNMYTTPEWHTIFYKNDGVPILRIGNNGQLACSNITVTTSNSNDALTLINTAQTNTIITIGRNNNTGNVAQIYMSYIGNDNSTNNFAIAFGGKSPVVQFFNDFSTTFSSRVLINITNSSYTNAMFTVNNTSTNPAVSMALLGPNMADGQSILSIHGKSADTGNTMNTYYTHASNNNANNSYSFGFYDKPNNLVLKNDLSSSFGGKVEVAAGVRISAGGLHVVATPDMSTEGAGIGWNYSGGAGETNFFNNNANGVVPGGWTWIPTTNTSVGSPVMSLSQTGNLTLSGTISASNLTVASGSWTPVLTCTNYNGVISQVHNTIAIGRYSISGKAVTLFYLISFDIYGGTPLDEWIILKGIPEICRVQPFQGNVGNQCSVAGEVSWFNSNIAGTANPIKWIVPTDGASFGGNPYAQPPPYFGLGNTYNGLGIYFYAEYPQGFTGYTDQRMSGYITYIIP